MHTYVRSHYGWPTRTFDDCSEKLELSLSEVKPRSLAELKVRNKLTRNPINQLTNQSTNQPISNQPTNHWSVEIDGRCK